MRRDRCLACGMTKAKDEKTILHRFPKNPEVLRQWINFCLPFYPHLHQDDDYTEIYLCSNHFHHTDYKTCSRYLKKGAVPTLICKKTKLSQNAPLATTSSVLEPDPHTNARISEVIFEVPTVEISDSDADESIEYQEGHPEEVEGDLAAQKLETKAEDEKRGEKRKFYLGDFVSEDMDSPKKAKTYFRRSKVVLAEKKKKVRTLHQKCQRMKKKICNLSQLVRHLKKQNLISEHAEEVIMDSIPSPFHNLMKKKLQKKSLKVQKYDEDMRKFAITLQFYSSRAYNYIRKTWKNLLPHPSTIRNWYSVVDGKPGFTQESFSAIKEMARHKTIFCNLILDEIKIKEEIIFSGEKFYGMVNLGTEFTAQHEGATKASYALVIMAVALNSNWKVPVGYFLNKSLTGRERANLLIMCLELMHGTGAHVHSITFDGAASNLSMCTCLGANLDVLSTEFKPWFVNPSTNEKIFVFLDACHMLKLARNTLGDLKVLQHGERTNFITWDHIANLVGIQKNEGLHAANKMSSKHIKYNDNRMSVKLAVQTLSSSTCKALNFFRLKGYKDFENSDATAEYCEIFDTAFDLLNVRNKFAKKSHFRLPICDQNNSLIEENIKVIVDYIKNLKDISGQLILKSTRKTGFMGIIIDLRNSIDLFTTLSKKGLDYLLTFKLSQDFLETFFSAVRSRGGFNNNPNARQFESAYKRLLVKHEITISNSNCLADSIEILSASSRRNKVQESIGDVDTLNFRFEHDYAETMWSSPFIDDVVKYIAGFLVGKFIRKRVVTCEVCCNHITSEENSSLLIALKNRGPYIMPSEDVIHVCAMAEKIVRQNRMTLLTTTNILQKLCLEVLQWINLKVTFESQEMNNHIKNQNTFDNHKINLIKLIIENYIKIRLYHEGKLASEKNDYIRQKYARLIIFKGQ